MLNRKTGCLALVVLLVLLGILFFRPPDLPGAAVHALERQISAQAGSGATYRIVSAEKAARTLAAHPEYLVFYPGGIQLPAGVYPPDSAAVQDNWCVTLDRPTKSMHGTVSHFLLQKRDGLWIVADVPDSQHPVFETFGCSRW
jgi:hypothetical protein